MDKQQKWTIQNLLTVKSIVTILLTVVFAVLSLRERVSAEQFLQIFTVIIAFYFGTQYEKSGAAAGEEDAR